MKIQWNKLTAEALARGALALVTIANLVAQAIGWTPLPVDEGVVAAVVDAIYLAASVVAAVVANVRGWWRNNSVTTEAQEADAAMRAAKRARRAGDGR